MDQIEFIKKYDFKFKKKFGQNFIIDENILNKIVDVSEIDKETLVIEIGCGAGALTKKIKEKTDKYLGYEIDKTLEPVLSTIDENIIYDDFLKRDINKDIENNNYDKAYLISNLPYYITTPIINKIVEDKINVDKLIIMVQKEVGDRFLAKPNSKDYGSITIFLNYYFNITKEFVVSRNVFIPKPNVDSVVLKFERKKQLDKLKNPELFFKLVRDSFRQRRKTLKNNLKEYNLEKLGNILLKNGIREDARAEQLSIEKFIEIANDL